VNPNFVIKIIKQKFGEVGSPAEIPKIKGGIFKAELQSDGVNVNNLGDQPFLPWAVFEEAFQLLRNFGGQAQKGNAMNSRLGDQELRLDSIEGNIAYNIYNKKEGESVFRRITPIAGILIWAGICKNVPNGLRLTDLAYDDKRIIRLHWNYFLALEKDVEELARYIEFDKENFNTFSIQLAHCLLSISSEVDVVAKELCIEIEQDSKTSNINDYRKLITAKYPSLMEEPVFLHRYNLTFKPWLSWADGVNPEWWQAYNSVKHKRGEHFDEANLKNVLNSLSGLFLLIVYLRETQIENLRTIFSEETLNTLRPLPTLLRLNEAYYTFLRKT
jgi:hypothetical protein